MHWLNSDLVIKFWKLPRNGIVKFYKFIHLISKCLLIVSDVLTVLSQPTSHYTQPFLPWRNYSRYQKSKDKANSGNNLLPTQSMGTFCLSLDLLCTIFHGCRSALGSDRLTNILVIYLGPSVCGCFWSISSVDWSSLHYPQYPAFQMHYAISNW